MGRASRQPKARNDSGGPQPGVYPIDTGSCELVRDHLTDGWILNVNGVQSSHINLSDPSQLDFEYMQWMAALIGDRWPASSRLRVLHLGAGACSMARHLAANYSQARQVAVDIDDTLARLVREWFDLPRAPLLRLRVGDAREVTESLTDNSRDLIIRDVFSAAVTPPALITTEFTAQVRRVLAPGGVYMVNCGDTRDLSLARSEAATLGTLFEHLAIIADPAMLKGRRYGNIVIAAADTPLGESPAVARALLGGGVPAHIWLDPKVRSFATGGRVLHDQAG
ncbi:spermidine synthase [Williamsia muralis]|uniref:Spermidine synthase n=1 Tax=Williamsia marianensis TaxID=85044 RepID=A0A2G3PJK6_WILMA|nr:fused MFS/spermidine synthase [Williamsia marianensis]PHV65990.1 spermidine synthase [Williamsia marianensis]